MVHLHQIRTLRSTNKGQRPIKSLSPWHIIRQHPRTNAGEMMDENRTRLRRRVLKAGKILFAHGTCTLDCTIKNISEHGAMLQIDNSVSVPDEFQLYEPTDYYCTRSA
jgi:hypothetical protein